MGEKEDCPVIDWDGASWICPGEPAPRQPLDSEARSTASELCGSPLRPGPAPGTRSPSVRGARAGKAGCRQQAVGPSSLVASCGVAWEAGMRPAACQGPVAFPLQQATPNTAAQNSAAQLPPRGALLGWGSAGLSLCPVGSGSIPRPARGRCLSTLCRAPAWARFRCPTGQTGCVSVWSRERGHTHRAPGLGLLRRKSSALTPLPRSPRKWPRSCGRQS